MESFRAAWSGRAALSFRPAGGRIPRDRELRLLHGAFDRVQRPGRAEPDEVPVGIGDVVDVVAETSARALAGDPARTKGLHLLVDIVGRELEPDAAPGLTAAVR